MGVTADQNLTSESLTIYLSPSSPQEQDSGALVSYYKC